MDDVPVVAVHGIGNAQTGMNPSEAAAVLANQWQPRLAAGYVAGGLGHATVPQLRVAYYAHLLADAEQQSQGGADQLESMSTMEVETAWAWLRAIGPPDLEEQQSIAFQPIRQALNWVAVRRGVPAHILARVVVAFAREVYAYLSRPERRRAARSVVAETLSEHRPRVVLAHSLGSVVTYEALHAYPELEVELLVTIGSPLGLAGAVFDALEPEPREGRGARPRGVSRWVNLADPGDMVALPRRLGDRFDVDYHGEDHIGLVNFHTLSGYLASGLTAAAIGPYTC